MTERQSNLEILRIVSMFLVLLTHWVYVMGIPSPPLIIDNLAATAINLEIRSLSIVCVHCFILISGYFGIRWKLRSILSLLFQIVFFIVIGYVMAVTLPFLFDKYPGHPLSFVKTVLVWQRGRWFISAYLCLYLLAPAFNAFIEKSSSRELGKFILVFYAFSTLYGWMMGSKEFATGLSAISLFGLYFVGAWIKKTDAKWIHLNKWADLALYFGIGLFMVTVQLCLFSVGISGMIYGYLNPLTIFEAIFLFNFFKKLKCGSVKWINGIAASAFAVFLFHCDLNIGPLYIKLGRIALNADYAFVKVLSLLICTFLIAVLIDKIRIMLFNMFGRLYGVVHRKMTFDSRIN